jgi:hypothetical protein
MEQGGSQGGSQDTGGSSKASTLAIILSFDINSILARQRRPTARDNQAAPRRNTTLS